MLQTPVVISNVFPFFVYMFGYSKAALFRTLVETIFGRRVTCRIIGRRLADDGRYRIFSDVDVTRKHGAAVVGAVAVLRFKQLFKRRLAEVRHLSRRQWCHCKTRHTHQAPMPASTIINCHKYIKVKNE